jgi:hypothetical protein
MVPLLLCSDDTLLRRSVVARLQATLDAVRELVELLEGDSENQRET